VVVPVRDGEASLGACLQAIVASEGLDDFELIVVDDGSRDASVAVAARFPCRLIRCAPGRGPAAARNRGAGEARGSVLAFVDADVIVAPATLARLVRALDEAPAVFASYAPEPLHGNFSTLLYHTLSLRSLRDTGERVPVFYSYCAVIGRSLFAEMGGFDPTFTGATFEDMELGWRLAQGGRLCLHRRDVPVVHAVRYDLARLARAYFRKSRDLAFLLLSRGALSFGDQGWTRRRNWALLFAAWGTLALVAPALWGPWPFAAAWALCAGSFLVASCPVLAALARRRLVFGIFGLPAFLAVHVVATAGMATGALAWAATRAPGRGRALPRRARSPTTRD
jgi:glycosyltransferase involved in cell wall biosynthesis